MRAVTATSPATRLCDWCRGPIPAKARADSVCCSTRCRQARHRFRSAIGRPPVAGGQPRRLAYADPPYPGKSALYYRDHPDYAGEVDHPELVASLSAEYDAWALSTSAAALPAVLSICPPGVRVAAWHRGQRPHGSSSLPVNAWEPVIYAGDIRREDPRDASRFTTVRHDASRSAAALRDGSPLAGVSAAQHDGSLSPVVEDLRDASRQPGERIDSLVWHARPRTTDPARVIGAKPAVFCRWIFDLLGARPGDTFVDVYPGSGGVARAWSVFTEAS